MKGQPEVIEVLNVALMTELTAVNQYFVDAKMASNWGYERLAKHFYDQSIDEMKDAEVLIERILFLDGMPNAQRLGSVKIGGTVSEKLRLALELEQHAVAELRKSVNVCMEHSDHASRDLLERMLQGEETHVDWYETQLSVMDQIGEAQYLALQMG